MDLFCFTFLSTQLSFDSCMPSTFAIDGLVAHWAKSIEALVHVPQSKAAIELEKAFAPSPYLMYLVEKTSTNTIQNDELNDCGVRAVEMVPRLYGKNNNSKECLLKEIMEYASG